MNETEELKYYKLLPNGRLDNHDLRSEYERGYVDCFNEHYLDIWQGCMIMDQNGEFILNESTYKKYRDIFKV